MAAEPVDPATRSRRSRRSRPAYLENVKDYKSKYSTAE